MSEQEKQRLNRRRFMTYAAASGAALGASSLTASFARAQDDIKLPMGPATPVPLGDTIPAEIADSAGNWPTAQANYAATRAADGAAISAANVGQLADAWRYPLAATTSAYGAITSNPVVIGDTIYFQTMDRNIHAVEKATGSLRWLAEYNQTGTGGPNGVGVGYGMVFAGLSDPARVVALDAATGEQKWINQISGNSGEDINVAPVVYNNTVYVSIAPGSGTLPYRGGARGGLFALDAGTGDVMWHWDTTSENIWGNARLNSGGGIWYPVSIDEAGNVYFGVGNPGPWPGTDENPGGSSREGSNAYASSMVSLDTSTGSVRWSLVAKPFDLFDHDFQNTPMLATATVNGAEQPIAIGSGKTGEVIAANADTGEELWRTAVGFHLNDDVTEISGDERFDVAPGVSGGVQVPAAYANGIVVTQVNNFPFSFGASGFGLAQETYEFSPGELNAIDVTNGEIIWNVELPTQVLGAPTIANDIVFAAGLDGVVRGYGLADGASVWSFQASAGINAPMAIAGDYLIIAAGAGLNPSPETAEPAPEHTIEIIALKLSGEAAPVASPVS